MVRSLARVLPRAAAWRAALTAAGIALISPAAAHAGWVKAETDRFVVYGDGDPSTVSAYARKLTIYDEALRLLNPVPKDRPAPQKVSVYLVRTVRDLRRVMPAAPDGLGGFYSASPQAVFAVALTGDRNDFGENTALFHEYAHHFMLENFPAAYPTWFTEGWAEYFSTTEIRTSGVVVGGYNANRVEWLFNEPWLPMSDLLTKDVWSLSAQERAIFYAQAWDFLHYMRDTPQRSAQLDQAIRAIAQGGDPVKAVEAARGEPLPKLTSELRNYTRIQTITIPAKYLNMAPPVTMASLPPAADDLLLDNLLLESSTPGKADPAIIAGVRARAARHSGDRLADAVLARLEFTFGDVAAGEAIVKRRLDADPNDLEFLRLGGAGQILAGERDPATRVRRFRTARPMLIKAYALDKSDFRTLYQYAVSRTVEKEFPDENDLDALLAARDMAPAVGETSILTAQALIRLNRREDASKVLMMVANNPHGGRAAAWARALIAGKSDAEARAAAEAATQAPGALEPGADQKPQPAKPGAPAKSAQTKAG